MTNPDYSPDDRRNPINYALDVADQRPPGELDDLDVIRASVRDFTQPQRLARLAELRGHTRPLSGRQRVEAALLEQQVATEARVMNAVANGTLDQFTDRPLTSALNAAQRGVPVNHP